MRKLIPTLAPTLLLLSSLTLNAAKIRQQFPDLRP